MASRDRGEGVRDGTNGAKGGGTRRKGPDALERTVSIVSLLLLLGAIGYLVWEGTRPSGPPAFETTIRRIHSNGDAHHVDFEVRNVGGESVQNLTVQVRAMDGGRTVAQARTSLSWLPSGSARRAVVVLPVEPREHELTFSVVGYELP